ncbi:recombinase family protein [Kitasatospora hibisci]|uniref:recombinase family protein n=1 Tax=Kitasatospora hibisci TaxID=3369522 RepID=UPI00375432C2
MSTPFEPDAFDLLVAEPAHRTEILIGYARVSTGGQKLSRRIDALTAAGCRRIFADEKSGKDDLRHELKACHSFLAAGDTLVVPALDRYGRSLKDLVNMVGELRRREIGFSPPCASAWTPPPPAAGSSSTSSPPSPSSSAS